jgi:hypothetical protein
MDASLAITFVVAILTQEVAAGKNAVFVDRLIQEGIDVPGMQLVEQQLSINMGQDFDILRDPASNLLHVQVRASRPQLSMQHGVAFPTSNPTAKYRHDPRRWTNEASTPRQQIHHVQESSAQGFQGTQPESLLHTNM